MEAPEAAEGPEEEEKEEEGALQGPWLWKSQRTKGYDPKALGPVELPPYLQNAKLSEMLRVLSRSFQASDSSRILGVQASRKGLRNWGCRCMKSSTRV